MEPIPLADVARQNRPLAPAVQGEGGNFGEWSGVIQTGLRMLLIYFAVKTFMGNL